MKLKAPAGCIRINDLSFRSGYQFWFLRSNESFLSPKYASYKETVVSVSSSKLRLKERKALDKEWAVNWQRAIRAQVAQAPKGAVNMTLRNSVIFIRVCMGIERS